MTRLVRFLTRTKGSPDGHRIGAEWFTSLGPDKNGGRLTKAGTSPKKSGDKFKKTRGSSGQAGAARAKGSEKEAK